MNRTDIEERISDLEALGETLVLLSGSSYVGEEIQKSLSYIADRLGENAVAIRAAVGV